MRNTAGPKSKDLGTTITKKLKRSKFAPLACVYARTQQLGLQVSVGNKLESVGEAVQEGLKLQRRATEVRKDKKTPKKQPPRNDSSTDWTLVENLLFVYRRGRITTRHAGAGRKGSREGTTPRFGMQVPVVRAALGTLVLREHYINAQISSTRPRWVPRADAARAALFPH